jgi:hypothetical protein
MIGSPDEAASGLAAKIPQTQTTAMSSDDPTDRVPLALAAIAFPFIAHLF